MAVLILLRSVLTQAKQKKISIFVSLCITALMMTGSSLCQVQRQPRQARQPDGCLTRKSRKTPGWGNNLCREMGSEHYDSLQGHIRKHRPGCRNHFPYKDNYYILRANALEDNVNIYKYAGGLRRVISRRFSQGAFRYLAGIACGS